ncbi:MAG TPA: low temperature requirement protein A [Actinomycetota bacterium]|nr:low temperature requirement protein A [Actinomycetota bacterium]
MRGVSNERHPRIQPVSEEARVTPIELFFDLVFVFSLTQVTALVANDLTARGMLRGILVLALLWWSWVGYAWLGNVVRADEGLGRVAVFGAMAAMFIFALSVPEAFDDLPGGLGGPVVVAFAYLAVRLLHLAIFRLAASEDAGLRRQLLRFMPSVLGSTALLLVASQLEGRAQTLAWVAAVVVDYAGTILAGASGWRLNSAGHFAERHGLILIVALGESIVAIGVGVAALPISWPIVVASTLGLTIAACVWWAYFDVVAIMAERVLRRAQGEERARLARDAYSYLHLPMVAGVVLLALGLKKVLEYVGDGTHHDLSEALPPLPLGAMFAGVAVYLLAQVAFKYRVVRTVTVHRVVVAAGLVALAPLGARIPALAALGLVAIVLVGLIAFESLRFAELREQVRHEEDEAIARLVGDG